MMSSQLFKSSSRCRLIKRPLLRGLFLVISLSVVLAGHAQKEIEQDFTAFVQSVNVEAWQGGEFRLTASVRVDHGTKYSHARLWARVDTQKSIGYFDNMADRPVISPEWKSYTIQGPLDDQAVKLVTGGICFGVDRYYFDDFRLEVRKKDGDWENLSLKNSGFEEADWTAGWKPTQQVKGFIFRGTTEDKVEGGKALVIDATSRPTDSRFIEANGISIHYKEFGRGDTVLFLHGNNESIQSFDKQIPEFSKKYHVIAIDSRGQGYSSEDGKPLTYELMAEDVKVFLERGGVRRVHVVGWSDGGNIGLILVMKYPDKVHSLSIMGANLFNDDSSVDPAINSQVRKQRERLVALNKPTTRFQIELCDLLLHQPNIRPEELKAIQCPALVMAGSRDIIRESHTRLIASSIPGARLTIFPRGTHDEPRKNPKRFNETVLAFLEGLPKR